MKTIWFKETGWTYVPVHFIGYLITLLAVLILVPVSMTIIRQGQPIIQDIFQLFMYTSCIAFWWKWIAEKNSI
ncbi:MAG TPA: hypothetical protein VEY32_05335 [Flavisolibacter sp.]|jgi:hypothetical protein|nr:hypothetical protein [Flavisolibacter sp.]